MEMNHSSPLINQRNIWRRRRRNQTVQNSREPNNHRALDGRKKSASYKREEETERVSLLLFCIRKLQMFYRVLICAHIVVCIVLLLSNCSHFDKKKTKTTISIFTVKYYLHVFCKMMYKERFCYKHNFIL